MKIHPALPRLVACAALLSVASGCVTGVENATRRGLAGSLTFHAPFDRTTEASVGGGDRRLQVGAQWGRPRRVFPGLPPGDAVGIAPGAGRYGDALRFRHKVKELVCYLGEGNIAYRTNDWSGTVSYWVRLDPDRDLEPGYCDTVQITSKDWNDAAFYTDFSKDDKPRQFRLGAYGDLGTWSPPGKKPDDVPPSEQPLAPVVNTPFGADHWTHVLFTWEHFNTGRPDGVARLYLDGELRAEVSPRVQSFTWDLAATRIMLGLSYTGLMDDLAVFDRALTPAEIGALRRLEHGVSDLHR